MPFSKLDVQEKCAAYFLLSEGDWGNFEKKNQDFVLTDKIALQKLKDNWVLNKSDERIPCGFGYQLFITQNDKVIEVISINEPCGYAVTTGGWYRFDSEYYGYIDLSKIQKLGKQEADSIRMAMVKLEGK